ncbi:protein kinase domain-containing protein, partial [Vibrio cholerae]|uniref:protein kinase domain-containing protein n=1 Tax=Vibrio cholerae TaxID=666 RepID=UPI001F1989C2
MTRDAGTVLYMAPEIWSSDQAYGPSCDIYSYGIVVIELWTGQNPFYPAEFTWILEFLDRVRNKAVVPGVEHMPP